MELKHTPGPWIKHNGTIYQAREDGGKFYAETAISGVFAKEDENLIAAAPEMLEALQHIMDRHSKHFDNFEFEYIHKIISKAIGASK